MDVLTGEGGRQEHDIIMVDTELVSFTNRLTNGVFCPSFKLHEDPQDVTLKILFKYLYTFVCAEQPVDDIRKKIKADFKLLDKFNSFKQTQAFLRIKKTLDEVMESND